MPVLLCSPKVCSGVIYGSVLNLSFLCPHFNDPSSPVFRKQLRITNTYCMDSNAYLMLLERGSPERAFCGLCVCAPAVRTIYVKSRIAADAGVISFCHSLAVDDVCSRARFAKPNLPELQAMSASNPTCTGSRTTKAQ